MKTQKSNTRYNIKKTFEYNKEKGPFEEVKNKNNRIKKILGIYGINADFFGFRTDLPIGVAAGTLHNIDYMEASMKDGFEVLTWKTFRSEHRLAHKSDGKHIGHNIVFLPTIPIKESEIGSLRIGNPILKDASTQVSITNSVGMPSPHPFEWMPMIIQSNKLSKKYDKLIFTSVVGTAREGDNIDDLARDYAFTARCAESAGSNIIELNLSCPNVSGKEGVIYKDIKASKIIAKTVRAYLRNADTKLLLKLGFADKIFYKRFIKSTNLFIDGIVAINTIPMEVRDKNGLQALPGGLVSGTCGAAILDLSVEAVKRLIQARKELHINKKELKIIGCGGVTDAKSFIAHIDAGAEFVMCATASLFNPSLPVEIATYISKNKINKNI